ncbi:hypothetical protein ACIQAC_08630 [Streptomyces sp. NPDC088387]|uniref:hypothetical protein n=1 Tax=Streptomyces sp. NPDC088387 TaxID=3365859 RepID=UPI0037F10AA2
MNPARRTPARHGWLRIAVLLLALLVPGAHTGTHALPVALAAGENSGQVAECDVLDTVVRPTARAARRPAAPRRPAPPPANGPARPAHSTHPAPPRPPYTPRCLRSVVLRC